MTHPGDTQGVRRRARHTRIVLWSFLVILVSAMALPSLAYLYASLRTAEAQQAPAAAGEQNPRANYWRAVREGDQGYSAVTGRQMDGGVVNGETATLINGTGQNWRQARNGPVAQYGGWILFGMLIVLMLYFGYRGQIRISGGRSGMVVPRWNLVERTVHWYTAILFVVLAITGLSLLFGRAVLIPLMGPEGFAGWASFSIAMHNYIGPPFVVGVLLMILISLKHNMPTKADLEWFKTLGGMFDKTGDAHPSSHKVNAGEKVVFWVICTFGVAVCVTGLILDFPNFGQTRDTMQIANVVHGAAAVIWMAVMLGHAYLGSIGVEGAYEAMTTGKADANWAKHHHGLWYEEVKDKAVPDDESSHAGMREQPT